jgi:hypothetical protein
MQVGGSNSGTLLLPNGGAKAACGLPPAYHNNTPGETLLELANSMIPDNIFMATTQSVSNASTPSLSTPRISAVFVMSTK